MVQLRLVEVKPKALELVQDLVLQQGLEAQLQDKELVLALDL